MTRTELATTNPQEDMLERVIAGGDLSKLTPGQRTEYYRAVCESLGLNPLTRPFEYITLQGKMVLYARRDATDQLRRVRGISVEIKDRAKLDGLYVVTASARDNAGRADESIGAVSVEGLKGENLANALMKCETKAKRRVTLSICGLGWSDETEIDTIPNARPVVVRDDGVIDAPGQVPPGPAALITDSLDMMRELVRGDEHAQAARQAHWSEDEESRRRFWAWTSNKGLSNAEVHRALGVEHLRDFLGDKAAAVGAINAYIEERLAIDIANEAHIDSILDRGDV